MIVGVIGSGTMGSGIAQVAATAGCQVKLFDTNKNALIKAESSLDRILERLIEKGRIDEAEKNRIKDNIDYVNGLDTLSQSDLIIEAIIEDLDVKKQLFSKLEDLVSEECIMATNTSSLSIASIASSLNNPQRCIGIHFFNPAPLMKLVEVIPSIQTSEQIIKKTVNTITDWGKTVAVAKDTPGFIVNRVARPFYSEALRIYEEGIADISTIDNSLKDKGGFRMGPFELMDFIGNDINYTVTETVFEAFYYDPRYKPSFTQKRYAEAGFLGRKSGRGYYHYDENGRRKDSDLPYSNESNNNVNAEEDQTSLKIEIFERVLVMLINEAADALFWNIASAKDIDNAMTKGVNYPKGLLAWANQKGIDWCVKRMDALYNRYHEDRYRCSPLLRSMLNDDKIFDLSV